MKYPIYLNYNHSPDSQVGWVEIEEELVPPEAVQSCAIVPAIIYHANGQTEVREFGLIQRTRVDTRPREELRER